MNIYYMIRIRSLIRYCFSIAALAMLVGLSLIACPVSWLSSSGGGLNEGTWSKEPLLVSFSFDTKQTGLDGNVGPYYLAYQDITARSTAGSRLLLRDGWNTISLARNSIQTASIVTFSDDQTGGTARSIGSTVMKIGNLSIISAGLDSIPIGGQNGSELSLGPLIVNNSLGLVEASTDMVSLSDGLALEQSSLLAFGDWDSIINKYNNVDIDASGTLDSDDQLLWDFRTMYYFLVQPGEIDFHAMKPLIQPALLRPDEFKYTFILYDFTSYAQSQGSPSPGVDGAGLLLPANQDGLSSISSNGGMNFYRDGIWEVWFTFPIENPETTLVPYPGDYVFNLEGVAEFSMKDLSWVEPGQDNKNLLIPIVDLDMTANGSINSLAWQWKAIQDGGYRDATPEEISLKVKSLTIAIPNYETGSMFLLQQKSSDNPDEWTIYQGSAVPWGYFLQLETSNPDRTTKNLGINYFERGSLLISPYNTRVEDNRFITVLYEDVGGNMYFFDYFASNYLIDDYVPSASGTSTWEQALPLPGNTTSITSSVSGNRLVSTYHDRDSGGNFLRSATIMQDGSISDWSAAEPFPYTLSSYGNEPPDSVAVGDSIYIVGSGDGSTVVHIRIDQITGTSTVQPANSILPKAISMPVIAYFNNRLYVADSMGTGLVWSSNLDDDGVPGAWIEACSLTEFFTLGSLSCDIAIDSTGHFFLVAAGGYSGHGMVSSVVLAGNASSDGLITDLHFTSNLPKERMGGTKIDIVNGCLYIFGGIGTFTTDPLDLFGDVACSPISADGNLGSWRMLDAFNGARIFHTVTTYDDSVYILGGMALHGWNHLQDIQFNTVR